MSAFLGLSEEGGWRLAATVAGLRDDRARLARLVRELGSSDPG